MPYDPAEYEDTLASQGLTSEDYLTLQGYGGSSPATTAYARPAPAPALPPAASEPLPPTTPLAPPVQPATPQAPADNPYLGAIEQARQAAAQRRAAFDPNTVYKPAADGETYTAPPPPSKQGAFWDFADQVWVSTLQMGQAALGMASAAERGLGADPETIGVIERARAAVTDHIAATVDEMSPEAQAAMRYSIFGGEGSPSIGEVGLGHVVGATVASLVPQAILAVLPGSLIGRAVSKLALSGLTRLGVGAAEGAAEAAGLAGTAASKATTAGTFGALDAGEFYNTLNDEVSKAKPEELAKNPAYQHLREQGLSDEDAKKQLVGAYGPALAARFAVGAVAGVGLGHLIGGGAVGGAERGALMRMGVGAGEGALTMGGQAAADTALQQGAEQQAGLRQGYDPGEIARVGASGALGGAILGGAGGFWHKGAAPEAQPQVTKDVGPDEQAALKQALPPPQPTLALPPPDWYQQGAAQGQGFTMRPADAPPIFDRPHPGTNVGDFFSGSYTPTTAQTVNWPHPDQPIYPQPLWPHPMDESAAPQPYQPPETVTAGPVPAPAQTGEPVPTQAPETANNRQIPPETPTAAPPITTVGTAPAAEPPTPTSRPELVKALVAAGQDKKDLAGLKLVELRDMYERLPEQKPEAPGAAAPETSDQASTTAGSAPSLTGDARAKLWNLGYSAEDIFNMSPQEAKRILVGGIRKPAAEAAPTPEAAPADVQGRAPPAEPTQAAPQPEAKASEPAPVAASGKLLGFELKPSKEGGREITDVVSGGPAERAGLRPGDRIVAVNGEQVVGRRRGEVRALVEKNSDKPPVFTVARSGADGTVDITVHQTAPEAPKPPTAEAAKSPEITEKGSEKAPESPGKAPKPGTRAHYVRQLVEAGVPLKEVSGLKLADLKARVEALGQGEAKPKTPVAEKSTTVVSDSSPPEREPVPTPPAEPPASTPPRTKADYIDALAQAGGNRKVLEALPLEKLKQVHERVQGARVESTQAKPEAAPEGRDVMADLASAMHEARQRVVPMKKGADVAPVVDRAIRDLANHVALKTKADQSEAAVRAAIAEWGKSITGQIPGTRTTRAELAGTILKHMDTPAESRAAKPEDFGDEARHEAEGQASVYETGYSKAAEARRAREDMGDVARERAPSEPTALERERGLEATEAEKAEQAAKGEMRSQGVTDYSEGGRGERAAGSAMERKAGDLLHQLVNGEIDAHEADQAYGRKEGRGRSRKYATFADYLEHHIGLGEDHEKYIATVKELDRAQRTLSTDPRLVGEKAAQANEEKLRSLKTERRNLEKLQDPDRVQQLKDALRELRDPVGAAADAEAAREPVTTVGKLEQHVQERPPDWAQNHADDVKGQVVYHDADTALVRGHSLLSGNPVYAGVSRRTGQRTNLDVDLFQNTRGTFTSAELENLRQQKREAVAADQRAYEVRPDGPFAGGKRVAGSASVDPKLVKLTDELSSLVGLKNTRIFLADPRDMGEGAAERYGLHGPYAAISSGALQSAGGGSVRRLANGDYYIALGQRPRASAHIETLAHEIGHILERESFDKATSAEKQAITGAYQAWLLKNSPKNAAEYVKALRAHTTGKLTTVADRALTAKELAPYWRSFGEWFADQVARWATTEEKPRNIVGKFFARIAEGYRRLLASVRGEDYRPTEAMRDWLNKRMDFATGEPRSPLGEPEIPQELRTVADRDPKLGRAAAAVYHAINDSLGGRPEGLLQRADLASMSDSGRRAWLPTLGLDMATRFYKNLFEPSGRLKIVGNPLVRFRDAMNKLTYAAKDFRDRYDSQVNSIFKQFKALPDAEQNKLGALWADPRTGLVKLGTTDPEANAHIRTAEQKAMLREMQKQYDALSPEAQKLYGVRRDLSGKWYAERRKAQFDGLIKTYFPDLTPEQHQALTKVAQSQGRIDAFLKNANSDPLAKSFGDQWDKSRPLVEGLMKLHQIGFVPGDYFPLKRFGDYVIHYGSKENGDYGVEMFERRGEAEARRAELAQQGVDDLSQVMSKRESKLHSLLPDHPLVDELENALRQRPELREHADAIRDLTNQLLLEHLADSQRSRMNLERQGIAGASKDAQRILADEFLRNSYDIAKHLHSPERTKALADMRLVTDDLGKHGGGNAIAASAVLRDMELRVARGDDITDALRGTLRKATSLGYAQSLMSFSHAITSSIEAHMASTALMGGRHGFGRATLALSQAMRQAGPKLLGKGVGKTIAAGKAFLHMGEELRANDWNLAHVARDRYIAAGADKARTTDLFDYLSQNNLLDHSMVRELVRMAKGKSAGDAWQRFLDMNAAGQHALDTLNKSAIAKAAYDLEYNKTKDHDAAKEYAADQVRTAFPNYNPGMKPRLMTTQGPLKALAPIMMQFKGMGLHIYGVAANLARESMKGATPEARSEARKAFAGYLATHALMAGALTLIADPLRYAGGAYDFITGADKPHDYQADLRGVIADWLGPTWGAIFSRGLPYAIGWDLHRRVGLANPLELPDLESFKGKDIAKAIGALAIGAPVEDATNMVDGLSSFVHGDLWGAFKHWVPRMIRDPMSAIELASKGVTDSKGRTILPADQISPWNVASKWFGIQPARVSEFREGRAAVQQAREEATAQRARLMQQWIDADPGDRSRIMQRINDFNAANPGARLTVSQLYRQLQEQRKAAKGSFGIRMKPLAEQQFAPAGRFVAQ